MRRKPGSLIPIEVSILDALFELRQQGTGCTHGFALAKTIQQREAARRLTGHGTLYKALDRLTTAGHLASRWEDPLVAAHEGRPRRRFYELTVSGEAALLEILRQDAHTPAHLHQNRATS